MDVTTVDPHSLTPHSRSALGPESPFICHRGCYIYIYTRVRKLRDAQRSYVTRCQKIAEGADWWLPRTHFKRWLSNELWRAIPYTPWKNMMLEVPLKSANSIRLENS